MKLEGNQCYRVLLTSGVVIKFKFLGNKFNSDELLVIVDNKEKNLFEILRDGYIAYEKIESEK